MCILLLIPAGVARPCMSRSSHPSRANSREPNVQKHKLTGVVRMLALLKREGRLLLAPGTISPVTPPCLTYDMACSSSCSSRTLLQTMGLWRHATTPRDLRCENYRISEGTSAEGIPNTSTISRDTANHVARCTNNHDDDGPDVHDSACAVKGTVSQIP